MQSARDGWMVFHCLADDRVLRQDLRYANFQTECGNYSGAAGCLYFFREIVSVMDRNALSLL